MLRANSGPRLPWEVLKNVVQLIEIEGDDLSSWSTVKSRLKACSLTCRALLTVSRQCLFHTVEVKSIRVGNTDGYPTLAQFVNKLAIVGRHVRGLTIHISGADHEILRLHIVKQAFKQLTKLEFLGLCGLGDQMPLTWPLNKSAFSGILSLPSLLRISLSGFNGVNFLDFASATNATCLNLYKCIMTLDSRNYCEPSSLPKPFKPVQLLYLNVMACSGFYHGLWHFKTGELPVFSFYHLSVLSLAVEEAGVFPLENNPEQTSLIRCCEQLFFLSLRIKTVDATFRGLADLVRPRRWTLRTLSLAGKLGNSDPNQLLQIITELRKMCGVNELTQLEIRIKLCADPIILYQEDYSHRSWNLRIDEVLTRPGAWPNLKAVNFEFVDRAHPAPTLLDQVALKLLEHLPFKWLTESSIDVSLRTSFKQQATFYDHDPGWSM